MGARGPAACLAAWCLLAGPAQAQDLSGFGELRVQGQLGVDGPPVQVVERFRPTFTGHLGERARLETTLEVALAQGRHQEAEVRRIIEEATGLELPAKKLPALNIDGVDDVLSVERLYADVYLPWADLRVGRQSITWGSALMINPTDPFPELLLAEPWRPRRGLDAARVIVALPGYNDLTAVVGTNEALDAVRAAGRLRLDVFGTDVALVGAWRSDGGAKGDGDGIVGLDVKGTLELGYWLEAALHLGDDRRFTEIAVGIDYSFPVLENLIVSAQYYRNGAGGDARGPATLFAGGGLPESPDGAAVDPFAPLLGGEHYLLGALSLGIDLDWTSSLFWLQNLSDGTALVVPTVGYAALDWLQVSLSAQIPIDLGGDGGELAPSDDDLVVPLDPAGAVTLDFSGLVPAASLTAWARASF